jgi:hypothetical protein
MGFFSKIRKRIKKIIPKEIRPFVPYMAAMIPGAGAAMGLGNLAPWMQKAIISGAARGLSDDQADLKDIGITAALAAAPDALGQYAKTGNAAQLSAGDPGFLTQQAKLGAAKLSGMAADKPYSTLALQGGVDAGIKAAELNEDALERYNRELLEQGIADKAGRRSAIRKIYENTGTWDMDEVDDMLDTYGYRTGGRVGYAMGDRVDTEQIIEDFQRIPSIGKGIGNLARVGADNIDLIIESLMKLTPFGGIRDIVEILVERYGVDPEVAQRKVINRMSDANRGFGPQGPQGTPDDGYNPNIGIDAGAEDYYGETPAMPENLGDMGGNMDDMSGNSILNRIRRGEEIMPRPDRIPPIPMPEMQPDPDRIPPVPMPTIPRDPRYFDNRAEFKKGGKTKKFDESDFYNSFQYAKEGLESLEEAEDEIKPLPIRELRLARGGIADINMEEQIDTPSGDMMMDENVEVASNPEVMDSLNELSLMLFRRPLDELSEDEYEELKDFAGQTSLKPGLIDEYRNYKYDMEEQGRTPMAPRDYFRNEFGAARLGVKKGGPIELNINVGGNNMEDIKGQTAGPQWYQDRIDALMFEFGDELTDDEIADIAFDSDKFYDKMGYDPGDFGGYKKGGRVGFESGDYVGSRKNETLEDEYGSYVKEIELGLNEHADKPMSFKSFKKMIAQDYKKGGKVIELMPKGILYKGKAKDYPGIKQLIKDMKKKGTRPKKADGGLMNLGGNEMDLRGGGFVPMGAKERADDVPARLSKNEFVMTADAVRGAGGGSVQKGADLMYDQMKRLEGQA